ncbi:MAG: hypothetical protein K9H16_00855 [Bacteroidales bacterium]|nr:hypothetical protein [Bacteroidales bacterium]
MKKINVIVLTIFITAFVAFVYYGCKKDEDSSQAQNSDGHIDMTIDGLAWSPTELYACQEGENLIVNGRDQNNNEFSFLLTSPAIGSFTVGNTTENGCSYFDGEYYYKSIDQEQGSITISELGNDYVDGDFDVNLTRQIAERDSTSEIVLKGNFHVERFLNNPYGWDRGRVTFYTTEESCNLPVRVDMYWLGGNAISPHFDHSVTLVGSFSGIPECEYGGYTIDYPPLGSRSGYQYQLLQEGEYAVKFLLRDESWSWTNLIGEDVITIEKQHCLLYEVRCDTGNSIRVITKQVTDITDHTAVCGGEISYSGTGTIDLTSRGVCWSTSPDPTIINDHTNDGNTLGEFSSTLTNLMSNTKYYVRAYTYDFITGRDYYGNQLSFQTTGTSSGNLSWLNLSIDGVTYYYETYYAVGSHGQGQFGRYYIGYDGLQINLLNPLSVRTYDINQPCFEGSWNENSGDVSLYVFPFPNWIGLGNSASSYWSTNCPTQNNPERYLNSFNGTVTITALNFEMISGQFSAKLDFLDENFNHIIIKDVYAEFTFYRTILPDDNNKLNHIR